jgi:aldehyde dehydrogenase
MIHEALAKFDKALGMKKRYDNFIGGKWVPPVEGRYFSNITPITSKHLCEVARSTAADIELALDAAHAARESWGRTSAAERSLILNRIADRLQENLDFLALVETIDNGKPIRETVNADLPLAVDHFRYYASCIRAHEGSLSEIDHDTVAYHFSEPLGVVGQIIPWNFPLLMAAWKLAPALAAGNCVVLKPAEQTPVSIMVFAELVADLLPPGVLNIVNGFGLEAGKPLAQNKRIAKIAFTGETSTRHPTSSSPTCSRRTTTLPTRRWKRLSVLRSIKARFAPAQAARSFSDQSTIDLSKRLSPEWRRSGKAILSTRIR